MRIFFLFLLLSLSCSAVQAQKNRRELLAGLSLLRLVNNDPKGVGVGIPITGVFHFTPHSSVTLGLEPFFLNRWRNYLDGFTMRAGYRYTSWTSGVFIHPNLGLAVMRLHKIPGNYTGLVSSLEMGFRLPSRKKPVELAFNINATDYLHHSREYYSYRFVWAGFKVSVVLP